ncbi:MAG: helix-turn-helix transcriptional regulator [Erysipelotrichaceae bacterium]|nr:helix-turn-helix transcriptional regulator [Erysipelotrichaceae bacterium]
MISFGENIRRLRIKKSLTQSQVGKICGVSAKVISRYENDQAEPDLNLIFKFSDLYDVDYNSLLGYKRSTYKKSENDSIVDKEIDLLLNRCSSLQKEFIEEMLRYIVNSDYDSIDRDSALVYIHEKSDD